MTKIEKQTFKNAIVILDDHAFIDCRFEKCTFFYAGGPCILHGFTAQESHFNFLGPAMTTIAILGALGMLKEPPTTMMPAIN